MLTGLSIRNVVLIEKLDLSFDKGLCVFTGETGAGKSILLDALSLALGARSDAGLIRYGADQLSVSAEFTVDEKHPLFALLKDQGLDAENPLILRRLVMKDGKSKAFVNDQPISASLLRQIGDMLIEIHGQFASHGLLNPTTHIHVLDAYGELQEEVDACNTAYRAWKEKQAAVQEAERILAAAKAEEEYLRHAVKELEAFAPEVGEEEALSIRRTALMNAEKITESLNNAYMTLSSGGGSTVEGMIRSAQRELEKASRLSDGSFDELITCLDRVSEDLNEAVERLEAKSNDFEDPASELEQVEERYFSLKELARKHRCDSDGLPDILLTYQTQLATLDKGEEELITLQKQREEMRLAFLKAAQALSAKRQKAAQKLDKAVGLELPALKLGKARFETILEELPETDANPTGLNRVTFCVSTNAAPPAPIHKIASGGELARFMLALKVNLAQTENTSTMIFDEVDSGIGGATASAVGERLRRLSEDRQVLVVTHSPQVAAFGTHHLNVSKTDTSNGAVLTSVIPLKKEERIEEIARMLSGAEITSAARKAAETLLEKSCL